MTLAPLDANPRAWRDLLALQPGAASGADWVLTEVGHPLCNSVFFPRWDAAEVEARIDAVLEGGRRAGVPQLWWLGVDPGDVEARLEARGVVVDGERMPGMEAELAAVPAPVVPDGLRVETVADRFALDAFAVPFARGFGVTGEALDSVLAGFAAYGLHDDVRHVVGFEGDRPVACASVIVRDGAAGLYDVATVPDARGRGYGAAVSAWALDLGRRAGAARALLHSSPDGVRIYERLGFRAVATVHTVVTASRWSA